MAKTIGSFELMAAVITAVDQELQKIYQIPYAPAAKWDKKYGFQDARVLGTFLGALQVRLRKTLSPHAKKLTLEPDMTKLKELFGQRADQTVFWVYGAAVQALSVNADAKII